MPVLGLPFSPALVLVLFTGTVAYSIVRYVRSPWRRLPPGPKGFPVIGNILQLRDKQWTTFTELKRSFGDLMYLNAAGQPLMVINSQKVAADLLDRRAGKSSGRPPLIVADVLTGGNVIVFLGYTDVWRRMRKATHEGFNKAVVHRYHPVQFAEAILLTTGICAQPQQWDAHFRRSAASSIMSIVYGTPPVTSENDPSVKSVNDHVARLTRANIPGAHLVEVFPWMRYLPSSMAKWKRDAEQWCKRDSKMFGNLFLSVRDRLVKGEARASLAATLIEDAGRNNLTESENAWTAGTMYAAGAETTAGVMAWFLLAMTAFPEVQQRAQVELDIVIGRSQVPTFSDYERLPYIRAIGKEVLRWRPVDPVGMPHRTTEDDWYEGYFIPAGSVILPNVWQMNRDPEIYGADAAEFNPARHLDERGGLAPAPVHTKEESHVSYGFGRRICIGRHVANNSLFINIAMMLWAMNIERAKDENGSLLPLDVDGCIEDGLVVRPVPFQCQIKPRFSEAIVLLEQEQKELVHH